MLSKYMWSWIFLFSLMGDFNFFVLDMVMDMLGFLEMSELDLLLFLGLFLIYVYVLYFLEVGFFESLLSFDMFYNLSSMGKFKFFWWWYF